MPEYQSEQESLASLVRQTDREPLDTADMIASSLMKSLGGIKPEVLNRVSSEIEASGDVVERSLPFSSITTTETTRKTASKVPPSRNFPVEPIMMALFQIHDDLISIFQKSGINSIISDDVVNQIRSVEKILQVMGAKVERFTPLDHVTGLTMPNMVKNAHKVIETTKQCYSLGSIDDATVTDDGKTINIVFAGKSGDIMYKASGSISSINWMGNEAVDYVYTSNGGKMSIKCFEGGKWIEKGIKGRYEVVWDLEERDLTKSTAIEENDSAIEKNKTDSKKTVSGVAGKSTSSVEKVTIENEEEDLANIKVADTAPSESGNYINEEDRNI